MAASVEELLQQHPARLWRAREQAGSAASAPSALPTGYAALDRCLPGQGWPQQGLVEILYDQPGIGELQLWMPALARLCSPKPERRRTSTAPASADGWVAWVSPPCSPYAPALAAWGLDVSRVLVVHAAGSTEWAMEQALRSEACSAVLGWANPREPQALRRLQLAAEQSRSLAVLFRRRDAMKNPSPAVLRVALQAGPGGLEVCLVKSRGGRPTTVTLRDPT